MSRTRTTSRRSIEYMASPRHTRTTDQTECSIGDECGATIDATCTRMPTGDLVIRLTPTADRERIYWMRDWFGSDYALATVLDYEREHGWAWVLPEDVRIVTNAPMLTDDGRYDAVSRLVKVWGSLWWYPAYRTCDPIDILLTRGAVTFQALVLR